VEQLIRGHAYDEYLVLAEKTGFDNLLASLLNYSLTAYRKLIPKGEVSMVATPAPAAPKLRHNRQTMVILAPLPHFWSQALFILP
jgi:hypothetical protein